MKYKITFDDENASTIEWISDEYKITDLEPYINSIHCDGGENIEELWGDDFSQISFDSFKTTEGDDKNTFKLLFRCKFEFEEKNFSDFKSALDNSLNQIEIKVGFKNKSGEIIDNDDLYEGVSDIPTKAQIL